MKKRVCVFLAVLVCMGCMYMVAEAAPLIKNGDFEDTNTSGHFTSWSTSLAPGTLKGNNAYYGESCLRLSSDTAFSLVGQNVTGISGGETYVLEFAFRPESSAFYPYLTLSYYNAAGKTIGGDVHLSTASDWKKAPIKNTWQLYEKELVMPEECVSLSIRLRMREAGSACSYDHVSLTKPIREVTGDSLLKNGTFEDTPDGDWKSQSGKWTDNFAYLQKGGYKDSACVQITSPNAAAYPYVDQYVSGLLSGGEYRVTLLLRTENITNDVRFKCEFYKMAGGVRESKGDCLSGDMKGPEGKWVQYSETFVLPQGADTVRLLLRIYGGTGTVRFDNVSLTLEKEPPRATVRTDKVFYYTGDSQGEATISLNPVFATVYTAVSATLSCEGRTVQTVQKRPFGEKISFSLAGMTEGKMHLLSVMLYDGADNVYSLPNEEIYMFPRPANIGEDLIWREADGTVFHPVFAYHLPEKDFPKAKEAGINLVQAYGPVSSLTNLLNSAQKNGIKVMVPLYANGAFAGDDVQRNATIETVRSVKNHPALFGYMIADEPYYVSHTSDIDNRLKKSYLAVKSEDTVHPVFLNESSVVPQHFEDAVRFTDVLCVDPYMHTGRNPASYVAERTRKAVEAAKGEKPVYILLQTFFYDGAFPEAEPFRNQVYQAFANGGMGIGYYKYENALNGKELSTTPLWGTLCEMQKAELPFLFDFFVEGKEKVTKISERVYSGEVAKEKYTVIFAGASAESKTETAGDANTVEAGGGLSETNFTFGNGQVTISLAPFSAGFYRLYKSDSIVFYKNGSPVRKLSEGTYTACGNFEKLYIAVYKETPEGVDLISFHIVTDEETEFTVGYGNVLKAMELSSDLSPKRKISILRG